MARRRGGPLEEGEKRRLNKKNLSKVFALFSYIKPYKWTFIAALVFLFISSINVLSLPFFAGKLINVSTGYEFWIINNIDTAALFLLGIFFAQSIFSFLRIYLLEKVNVRAMNDLRIDLFESFMALPMSFYDNQRAGELTSRISNDISMLRDTFSTTLAEFVRQVLTLTAGIAIIFISAPKLSLFMLATFPVVLVVALFFGKVIRKYSKKAQDLLANSNTIVEEVIQSIHAVKAFTNERFEIARYRDKLTQVIGISLRMAAYNGVFVSFIIFGLFGAIVAVMWYGASMVQSGEMSIGDLFSFLLYTVFIGASIGGLGSFYSEIQRAIGASERILEIINEPGEYTFNNKSLPKENADLRGQLVFKNVSFVYPSRQDVQVLKNLSFEINQGEKVALVGHSGAGKSTIANLVMRFYNPSAGEIRISDKNIQSFDLHDYRKNIAVVPQEVILFGTTIAENIAYGKPGATRIEIEKAAKQANALGFIQSFPEGFNTLVGDRGIKLSGGQRQRIAIARAIIKDPTLLVLDEATSSLDSESEAEVQKALEVLMKERTSIIIAHRLATIRNADKIVVLDRGELIEQGSYEDLSLNDEGYFQRLLKLQFQEPQLEDLTLK